MVLVISGIAIVLGLCVGLLFTMMKVDRSGRAQVTESLTLERLARQFRQDARAAERGKDLVVKNDNTGGIELFLPDDRVIEYRRSGTNVERIEHGPGAPDRREVYRLLGRAPAVFSLDGDAGQSWAVLLLPVREDPARLTPARPVRVEAPIGKDLRVASREEKAR